MPAAARARRQDTIDGGDDPDFAVAAAVIA
jgi:hypothetical protein